MGTVPLLTESQYRGEGRDRVRMQRIIRFVKNVEVVAVNGYLVGLLYIRQDDGRLG